MLALLLARVKEGGVPLKRRYLDRGFYSIAVCRYLQEQSIPALMPGVKQGKKGGIRKLFVGRKSYQTTYTLRTQKTKEEVTIDVAIVCTYQKGKRGKRGCRLFGYAFFNYTPCLSGLHDDSRHRFGIETSYRVSNQARGWTTSREPVLRLVFFGSAWLLENIWGRLKWSRVSLPRRGGRLGCEKRVPFRRMLRFLLRAIQRIYGVKTSLPLYHPGEGHPTTPTL